MVPVTHLTVVTETVARYWFFIFVHDFDVVISLCCVLQTTTLLHYGETVSQPRPSSRTWNWLGRR